MRGFRAGLPGASPATTTTRATRRQTGTSTRSSTQTDASLPGLLFASEAPTLALLLLCFPTLRQKEWWGWEWAGCTGMRRLSSFHPPALMHSEAGGTLLVDRGPSQPLPFDAPL